MNLQSVSEFCAAHRVAGACVGVAATGTLIPAPLLLAEAFELASREAMAAMGLAWVGGVIAVAGLIVFWIGTLSSSKPMG